MKSNSMYIKPIVELEILKIVDQLKPNKSGGHDKTGNFIKKSERWNCQATYMYI